MNNDREKLLKTMLSLAYTVDSGVGVKGDSPASNKAAMGIIQCMLNTADMLKKKWKLVWGPRVYDLPIVSDGQSDNTMIVAQQEDTNTYAVAIAGTNAKSWSDWFFEDFAVGTQVLWRYGSPDPGTSPKISWGTAFGLAILQRMRPYKGIPGEEKTLAEFLQYVLKNPCGKDPFKIYVTGHSLGGALAPATALWLSDTQGTNPGIFQVPWDPDKKAKVYTFPFAGPTIGNGDIANYINSRFTGDQMVVTDNQLDIAPHAWNYETLEQIHTIYPPPYALPPALGLALDAIAEELKPLDYQPIGTDEQRLKIPGNIHNFPPPPPQSQLDRFAEQAAYQHICAYPIYFGLEQLLRAMADCSPGGLMKMCGIK